MIDINVVLIADRIEKKENMDSYDLEKSQMNILNKFTEH